MNKAPSFKYVTNLPNSLNELKVLPEHLEEFYKAAQIEELYKKYEKDYEREQKEYQKGVYEAIAKVNYYLAINNKDVQPFAININLLDAYWRGSGLGSGGY